MSVLIKNGRIVTATDDYQGDVLIEGETVVAMGHGLAATADKGLSRASHLPTVSSDSFLGRAGRRNRVTPRFQSVAGSAGVPAQRAPAGTQTPVAQGDRLTPKKSPSK